MKLNIGVVGFGEFSRTFLELFMNHPDVGTVKGAEIIKERRDEISEQFGIEMYSSYEEMLEKDSDINAVAIFSQRHQHGPMAIAALKAGKHVFSAVPVGCTMEEVEEIVRLVEKTGLTYMSAETCYYFPCAILCREYYKKGFFGDFVYGESQYYHDISAMFDSFSGSGGNEWKKVAGVPPMYYSTHSMSMLFSAIGDHPVSVSCFGYTDNENDDIYGKGKNYWDNPFSNEVAIMRMSKGGIARINEFRRIGTMKPSSYITGFYGKKGAYEGSGMNHFVIHGEVCEKPEVKNVAPLVNTYNYEHVKDSLPYGSGMLDYLSYHTGYSEVQDIDRLPEEIRFLESRFGYTLRGHNGSHPFLVDDFVRAVCAGLVPPNNVWDSAVYSLSGIVAHDSAMNGGKEMDIPYMGAAPDGWSEKWDKLLKDYKKSVASDNPKSEKVLKVV